MASTVSGVIGVFGRLTMRTASSGRVIRPHVHSELSILAHDGGMPLHMSLGSNHYVLDAGQAMFIEPWQVHAPIGCGEGPRRMLTFFLEPLWLDSLKCRAGIDPPARVISSRPFAMGDESVTLLRDTAALSLQAGAAPSAPLEARIAALVQALLRERGRQGADVPVGETATDRLGAPDRSFDARIRRVVGHLATHPTEPFEASRLAKSAGLSRSQFFKLFKTEMGCPPRYFADAARVRYAIGVLSDRAAQIADIADTLGFSAPGHFTNFFSQHMGVAPGVYRRHLLHLIESKAHPRIVGSETLP